MNNPRGQKSKGLKGASKPQYLAKLWFIGLPLCGILSFLNLAGLLWALEEHFSSSSPPSSFENVMVEKTETSTSSARPVLKTETSTFSARPLLPPSIWSTRKLVNPINITSLLTTNETKQAMDLCGKFFYSTLQRAVHAEKMAEEVFVATGDIAFMWIRDSAVQMSIYLNHHMDKPWMRFLVEGAIRRNAFNILQDPYGNAYYREWKNPDDLNLKERVIGRGGFVATRNYELDSACYFLIHLYDYFMAQDIYRPEALLEEPIVFEAVMLMIDTWIVEQHHEELSPYRYFELPRQGLGSKTVYTGMTWTGFRPSDDACDYGYLIPANCHAAAALERVLILNDLVWKEKELETKASKLLKEIEEGINKYGIITDTKGNQIYAYEVDGMGGVRSSFDDANIPSLLSIPLLGWSGYDNQVYQATREKILSKENPYYFQGSQIKGIGSPHTAKEMVWPMSMVVQGLTEESDDRAEKMAFQMRQLLLSACKDAMHESVHVNSPCQFSRPWFEWVSI